MLGTWYGFWTWGAPETPMPGGYGGWQAAVIAVTVMSLLLLVRW